MNAKRYWFLIVVASICLIGLDATGLTPKVPPELVGTWSYATMSALKNGKPFGVIHFQLGQWTVTFNNLDHENAAAYSANHEWELFSTWTRLGDEDD